MRLKNDTPAKIALEESLKKTKKKVRRPPATWIKLIEKDLSLINIQLHIESNPAENPAGRDYSKQKELEKNCQRHNSRKPLTSELDTSTDQWTHLAPSA